MSLEVHNRGISGPTERTDVLQKFRKRLIRDITTSTTYYIGRCWSKFDCQRFLLMDQEDSWLDPMSNNIVFLKWSSPAERDALEVYQISPRIAVAFCFRSQHEPGSPIYSYSQWLQCSMRTISWTKLLPFLALTLVLACAKYRSLSEVRNFAISKCTAWPVQLAREPWVIWQPGFIPEGCVPNEVLRLRSHAEMFGQPPVYHIN